ncbi:MAG: hypothetical protein EAY65_01410, partial [Alphaproteobacteria bacterium]
YNHLLPQKAIGYKTPAEAIAEAMNSPNLTGMDTRKSLKEWEASRDRGSTSFLWEARIVLEADAEVIEDVVFKCMDANSPKTEAERVDVAIVDKDR